MKEKKWLFHTIMYVILGLLLFIVVTVVIDPYFHFHKPINGISYRLYEERYINNGIVRHFDYDAIITGSSTTENFKVSEFNQLFECNAVKVPFSGGTYREVSENLQAAFSYNSQIEKVLWALDWTILIADPQYLNYSNFPTYLYDNNVWNDVKYILNKDTFYHGTLNSIMMTIKGQAPTSFDDYATFSGPTGKEAVMQSYVRRDTDAADRGLTEEERIMVENNVKQNICTVISENPNTTFYIFFPPYSIVRWDSWNRYGLITAQIEAGEIASEILLQYDNVKLFCFFENEDLIFNLDNYKDDLHYSADVNSQILEWIRNDVGRITLNNYKDHAKAEKERYVSFDYDSLFE